MGGFFIRGVPIPGVSAAPGVRPGEADSTRSPTEGGGPNLLRGVTPSVIFC